MRSSALVLHDWVDGRIFFPIVAGGTSNLLLKHFGKVSGAGKSCAQGDFRDADLRVCEERNTLLDAVLDEILKQRHSGILLEKSTTFTAADMYGLGNIFQCDFFLIVRVNIV